MWSPVGVRIQEFFTRHRDRGRHDAYLTSNTKDPAHSAAEALWPPPPPFSSIIWCRQHKEAMWERALIIHVSQHLKEYLSFIASNKEKWNCSKLPLTGMRGREGEKKSPCQPFFVSTLMWQQVADLQPVHRFCVECSHKTAHSVTVVLECL